MRIAVTGASGNLGTSVLGALGDDREVDEIIGIARRPPSWQAPKLRWVRADVAADDLVPAFTGADVVIHLAWLIQPSRDPQTTWATNVLGSERVFAAAADAGVSGLVYASSIGAYSAGPKDRPVTEAWPTDGVATSIYSREKAYVERVLDAFEMRHSQIRVVRLRPGFVLKRSAASGIRRLFAGPWLPTPLLSSRFIPVIPRLPLLRFQTVHSLDVGQALRLAALRTDARGAFNLAAEPPIGPDELAELFHARTVPVPAGLLRALAAFAWRARLVPTEPGMVDLLLAVPLMDTTRARDELGWKPTRSATEALCEVVEGMREGAGADTPALRPSSGLTGRWSELRTGVGVKDRP